MTKTQRAKAIKAMETYLLEGGANKLRLIQQAIAQHPNKHYWFSGFESLAQSDKGLDMMEILMNITLEYLHQGWSHIGTRRVFEMIRYEKRLREPKSLFTLDNNYFRSYILLLKALVPELASVYENRGVHHAP